MQSENFARQTLNRPDPIVGATSSAVLYAAPYGPQSLLPLLRADALARSRGERLIVLRVVPRVGSGDPLFPRMNSARATRLMRLEAAVRRLTVRWCARHLVSPPDDEDVRVVRGGLHDAVERVCSTEEVSLVVLPRFACVDGAGIEALALSTRVPLMVAARQGASDLVIAGSDLEDRAYPVLRFARDLCSRMRAPSLFLHNVSPFLMALPLPDVSAPASFVPGPKLLADSEVRLKAAARRIDNGAATTLQHELDAATALVDLASKRGADVVVVGARPRPWWRLLDGSVAARVVERAPMSVLVLPLEPSPSWLPSAWS